MVWPKGWFGNILDDITMGGNSNKSQRTAGREWVLETIHSQNCWKRNNAKLTREKCEVLPQSLLQWSHTSTIFSIVCKTQQYCVQSWLLIITFQDPVRSKVVTSNNIIEQVNTHLWVFRLLYCIPELKRLLLKYQNFSW